MIYKRNVPALRGCGRRPDPMPAPRGHHHSAAWLELLVASSVLVLVSPGQGFAQAVDLGFPKGVAGYEQQRGVTVQSRLRPLYDAPGIRLDGFTIRANLDETGSYNSNPLGTSQSGSFVSKTSLAASAISNWSRNALGATVGVDHSRYVSQPAFDYTDWNVGLLGGVTVIDELVLLKYAHNSYNQIGPAIGTTNSAAPVENQTDTARLNYIYHYYRFAITPEINVSSYRFGPVSNGGKTIDQSAFDRSVLSAGVTTRYELDKESGVLVVVRDVETRFTHPQIGQPSSDSSSVLMLAGLDYQASGLWRYRLLGGAEMRSFAAARYPRKISPIIEASAVWSPTGVLTVASSLSRAINDAQIAGTNGYVLTKAAVQIDYELLRNVTLQADGNMQYAEYLGGGTQTGFGVGASANWLVNRRVRFSLAYLYTHQNAATGGGVAANVNAAGTGRYRQHLIGLGVHFAL